MVVIVFFIVWCNVFFTVYSYGRYNSICLVSEPEACFAYKGTLDKFLASTPKMYGPVFIRRFRLFFHNVMYLQLLVILLFIFGSDGTWYFLLYELYSSTQHGNSILCEVD